MSSCVASCSICYRVASFAYATSASSLTAAVLDSCRSASNCCVTLVLLNRQQQRTDHTRLHGVVRYAVEPCTLSSASPLPNFSSALRHRSPGVSHDSASRTPPPSHRTQPTGDPCVRSQQQLRNHPSRRLSRVPSASCRGDLVRSLIRTTFSALLEFA